MKFSRFLFSALIVIFTLNGCSSESASQDDQVTYQCPMKCEGDKTSHSEGSCPVCKMDLMPIDVDAPIKEKADEISEMSIFNLKSVWKTEENKEIQLEELKGKTVVMVMIYTTCQAACPRLVADMRNISSKIPKAQKNEIQYVLVSISPETDTPVVLKAFAIENKMDGTEWTFLQGTTDTVRELANVLAVKYKEISPIDFSHSNIISVFNPGGDLVHQQEGLGVDNAETVSMIIKTAKS